MAKDDRDKRETGGGRHENENENRRERNGQPTGPIDPDTIRVSPHPVSEDGKPWSSGRPMSSARVGI
jgi:hypothetical protein